jgi:hypothetical protein
MSSFANMKRNSNSLDKLKKAIAATSQPTDSKNSREDTRFWKPEVDKAGNGMAVIRFLPAPEADGDEGLPFVRVFHHGFQGPGGWFIDNCLTTIDTECPVCKHNSTLWNSGIEANKDIVRKQKRKLNFISNIYVVSDPSNPDNEGKVFLYKYGKKIFDKITEAMNPQFPDEPEVAVFDMWKGADFRLKIRNVEGYRNYDKSVFDAPSVLFGEDDELKEKIWKQQYSLQEFLNKSNFKSYEQLKTRLDKVLGVSEEYVAPATSKATDTVSTVKDDVEETMNKSPSGEEDLDYFKSLADAD